MSVVPHSFFAAAPRGVAHLLADEARGLGAGQVTRHGAGVSFGGTLEIGYRVCLWSRLASRVLLILDRVDAVTAEALYAGVRALPWEDHLAPSGTLAVACNGTSPSIRNSHYGALKVKDAIVDRFRDRLGARPSVDLRQPDLRVDVHLYGDTAVVSIDLSGGGLHRRGWRVESVTAPLKETLAAALLARAGWPGIGTDGGWLVDPMCGSGTLLIEAAWMAADRAPALERTDLGLHRWRGHDAGLWQSLVDEARQRAAAGAGGLPPIRGFDAEAAAVSASLANVRQAGLETAIHVERRPLAASRREGRPGLVVTNPPYGRRLGDEGGVRALHAELATQLRACFGGWRAVVLTALPEWAASLGLTCLPERVTNGPLECRILLGQVPGRTGDQESGAETLDAAGSCQPAPCERNRSAAASAPPNPAPARAGRGASGPAPAPGPAAPEPRVAPGSSSTRSPARSPDLTEGAQMLANRLRKNLRTLGRWARRHGVQAYRLYDADMPEYAVAVDVYQCAEGTHLHVQEYRAPDTIDPERAAARLQEALTAIRQVLEVPDHKLHFKVRQRQRGPAQYRRTGQGGAFHEVGEGPCTFLVNFTHHLDTGLFLDHRTTRSLLADWAPGRRFLNLFAYTGTATVYAALGGATSSTTVDLSRTYLDWARRNLDRNGLDPTVHRLEAADCLAWLATPRREHYGLIFLDPPTFSNSKRMDRDSFDVQRDHVEVILQAADLLTDDGILVFSTNLRRFQLDEAALQGLCCQDISRRTLPRDFARSPRIHRVYRIERA